MAEVDFKKILINEGIPTTQDQLNDQWKDEVVATGSEISNDNTYSPFWRVITAIVTQPALWLIEFLITTVLPNSFVKTASGTLLDLLAWGYNVTRKTSTKTLGNITFSRSNLSQSITIPVGVVVQTASLNGVVYQVMTTESKSFSAGEATLLIAVEAVESGAAFNLANGYYGILVEPISNISNVSNDEGWLSVPGTDVETDDDLRARVRNQFGTASDFHTDSVYRALISDFPAVNIDAIWFEHDAPRGPGTANAFVLFDFTAPVTQYLASINTFITDDGNHGHGDDLQVYQMPEQSQTLSATVWHEPFLSAAEILQLQADVGVFINAAFRENLSYSPTLTLPYDRFSFSRLSEEVHQQFPNIHSVDFSLPDIVSALSVPRLTSLTVDMQVTE